MSELDCDWYISSNFVDSPTIKDPTKNATLCEEYFAQQPSTFQPTDISGDLNTETTTLLEPILTTRNSVLADLVQLPSTVLSILNSTEFSPHTSTSTIMETMSNNTITTTTHQPFDVFVLNEIGAVSKKHNGSLNASLCQWYLPTIYQVPRALGHTGIALWVLGFIITFTLIMMFVKQFHFIYTTAHKSFRRHLYSINSIYVVMALMTSIGSGIPRAHAVCSAMKDVYMAIGIGHFVDLTISMYGGENVMAWYLRDRMINVRVIPFFKCFCCIPQCKTKKLSVNILKWLVWQMKWSQAIYYLIKLIWKKSLENSIGIVPNSLSSSFLYMHIINVMSFISGVFSLLIISSLVRDDLQEKYNYTIKAKTVRFTILTTKLQRLLFEILEAFDVFPCIPPLVSKKFYKNVLKDFIYLVEVLILGTITFFVYTKPGQYEKGNSKHIPERLVVKDEDELLDENGFEMDGGTIALQIQHGPESMC